MIPDCIFLYVDEYCPVTAHLEILTAEIRKSIKGNSRLDDRYFSGLNEQHSIEEKLTYARHFRRCLEEYRKQVDTGE